MTLRGFLTGLFRLLYRLEVRGQENLAAAGPNPIIALNHVSFLDAAVAMAVLPRDPVFAIDREISQRWWVRPFLRYVRAKPLDPANPLAVRSLIKLVQDGETLVIFPEGRLTVTGSLMKVYDGAGLIADKAASMVVPVRLDGLEKTHFTRLNPRQVRRRWFPKVRVTVLPPVKLEVDPELRGKKRRRAAGTQLYEIMSNLVFRTTPVDHSIGEAMIGAAREHGPGRTAVTDPMSGALSYRRLLAGARVLGGRLAPLAPPGCAIGVLLPSANGTAAATLGILLAGRVPAMLNFTAGAANLRSACKTAEVRAVVTSRAFIEKAKLAEVVAKLGQDTRIVYLEDVRDGVGTAERLWALAQWRLPLARPKADGRAVILFTSGSEGAPKAVVLSHRNILSNVAQAAARIAFGREDTVLNVLPMFHAFGLTVGTVLPLLHGVKLWLYPSPLHYRIVPELAYIANATVLFGTDTFLSGYARMAHPYDFHSLRYVLAGAEPLKTATRAVWMEKFGLRILEGYGVTETAPALTFNTPMYNRFGTVGRLMPGLEARIEPVEGVEEGGRLFVRGPNVMLGYLRAEAPGVLEPPPDGWYDTGDIVTMDEEGFITIRGRAKRFAKVGGEMVSLAAVEALAAELWPDAMVAAAVRPDPRKGERLVLVTDREGADRAALHAKARERGIPELMVPAEVRVVDKLPLLGTGKIDHIGVAKLIDEAAKDANA